VRYRQSVHRGLGRAARVIVPLLVAFVAVLAVAAATLARAASAAPAATPASADDGSRLIYLLEYVGTDYGDAVRDGQVVNQFEYGEVLRFVKELQRDYAARRDRSKAVLDGVTELQKLMVARAPADQVFAKSRALLPALTKSVGGGAVPATTPRLADGRRLYERDCASCHGESGAGDGDGAVGMDPPPTPFRGAYMEHLTPRRVFNALTFGVPETAMPSFAESYDAQQRWDVAFYTMTLRVGFAPRRPTPAPGVTLAELASSSNAQLLASLKTTSADASPEEVDWLRSEGLVQVVTAPPSAVAASATQPARVSSAAVPARGAAAADAAPAGGDAAIGTAIQLQDAFSSVAARVFPRVVGVTGYVRDASYTPEQSAPGRGPVWTAASVDALRYPGYRPLRSGSGFLVDDEGFVLSRDQLLRSDAGELVDLVDVELADHSHRVASIVGSEPALDLGVLQLGEPDAASGTAPFAPALVELGDAERLAVGHWLLALGDPPGAEQNLAVGIVAAPPARQCYQQEISATRLQSSLVIPERARGGPVVDIQGRVVGLSVGEPRVAAGASAPAAAAPAPASVGGSAPGHVLPINLVLNLYEALKIAHSTRSPWIGVSVLELDRVAAARDPSRPAPALPVNGVGIDDVFVPSPAVAAGVRTGDFLVELGGQPVQSVADFQKWMYVNGIGKKVELGLLRDGKPLRVSVTIEARPAEATTR